MAEYMKIGGFTPPKKVKLAHQSPAIVKRFDSLEKLPYIRNVAEKAMTPLQPKSLKVPSNSVIMNQAMDYVAAYNRLKAQFRQEGSEQLPYIFEKQVLADVTANRLGARFDQDVEELPRSQLEHYRNRLNLFDENLPQ